MKKTILLVTCGLALSFAGCGREQSSSLASDTPMTGVSEKEEVKKRIDISGIWYVQSVFEKSTKVSGESNGALTVQSNYSGETTNGFYEANDRIHIPELGSGKIAEDGEKITFSGGMDWTREPAIRPVRLHRYVRWYLNNQHFDNYTTTKVNENLPSAYRREVHPNSTFQAFLQPPRMMGHVQPIYSCLGVAGPVFDNFLSIDAGCEGLHRQDDPVFYLYDEPGPGRVPVWRCFSRPGTNRSNHVVTTNPDVECTSEFNREFVLGYGLK